MDRTDDVLEKCRVFCIRRRHEGSERANEGGSELNCTVPFPCGRRLVGWLVQKTSSSPWKGISRNCTRSRRRTEGRTDGRIDARWRRTTDEMPVDRRAEEEEVVAPGGGDGGGGHATERDRT